MLDIFKKANKHGYAVGAFNVSNLEQVRAIVQAAQSMKSPALIATSQGEGRFFGFKQLRAVIDAYNKETGLALCLHLDHGKKMDIIKEAIEAGYDSIHFDGSGLDFEENVKQTKEVVKMARDKGVKNIEGELGYLRGASVIHEIAEHVKEEDLTDPEQAKKFINLTGVDSLAVSIGNIHGVVKNAPNPHLFLDRLEQINQAIGGKASIVLHGASGTPEIDIREAIGMGVDKININTELRMAYIGAIKMFLEKDPNQIRPYIVMAPAIEAVQSVVEDKIELFGSKNRL